MTNDHKAFAGWCVLTALAVAAETHHPFWATLYFIVGGAWNAGLCAQRIDAKGNHDGS